MDAAVWDSPWRRARARAAAPAAFAVVLLLTGCAGPPNVADRSYRGMLSTPAATPEVTPGGPSSAPSGAPPGASPAPPLALGQPLAGWVDKPRRFGVTLWGSSSCPAVPIRIEATGNGRVRITFEQSGEKVCTADLAPTTHEFTVPAGADTLPLAVTLVDGKGGAMHTLVLE